MKTEFRIPRLLEPGDRILVNGIVRVVSDVQETARISLVPWAGQTPHITISSYEEVEFVRDDGGANE